MKAKTNHSNQSTYSVTLSQSVKSYSLVEILANSPEDAAKIARNLAKDGEIDFCDSSPERIRIESVNQQTELI